MFRCTLTPSFCNQWPEVQFIVNGTNIWQNHVTEKQIVNLEFDLQEENKVEIVYLNKRAGPDIWDTKIDSENNILEDQNCIASDFFVGGSRCDFLLDSLDFYHDSGVIDKNCNGFMSKIGRFVFNFPKDIYKWVSEKRNQFILKQFGESDKESSLSYFENFNQINSELITDLLKKIDSLLEDISNLEKS